MLADDLFTFPNGGTWRLLECSEENIVVFEVPDLRCLISLLSVGRGLLCAVIQGFSCGAQEDMSNQLYTIKPRQMREYLIKLFETRIFEPAPLCSCGFG